MVCYTGNSARLFNPAARLFSLNIVTRLYPAPVLPNLQAIWFCCTCDLSRLDAFQKFRAYVCNVVGELVMCSRICSSQLEFEDLYAKLKITECPHCKTVGQLIKHGFLRGYDSEHQLGKTVRATRVFCSNRNRATGCGKTFSVWMADKIKHLFLSAESLWQFLSSAVSSGNKLQAFRKLNSGLSDSSAYHIWRRFRNSLSTIRTALLGLCEPPSIESDCPAQLTLVHLQHAFKEHSLSPIAAFAATLKRFFI